MQFLFTVSAKLETIQVTGKMSATNGGAKFTEGAFKVCVAGTPTKSSLLDCVGKESKAAAVVRKSETVMCTITVKGAKGATTGVASDFVRPTVTGGSGKPTVPTTGTVTQAAGAGSSGTMTHEAQAPNVAGSTFETETKPHAALGGDALTKFAFDVAIFPDAKSVELNMNNIDTNTNKERGAKVTVTFRATTSILQSARSRTRPQAPTSRTSSP